MLPILWNLVIPAGWALPGALVLLAAIAVVRAVSLRRRSPRRISWGAALWDDRWLMGALLGALLLAWRSGRLDGSLTLPIHSYGVALAAGFVTAISLAQRQARRLGQDPERMGDMAFWILVSALVGSRVYFILVNWRQYFESETWLVATRFGQIPRVLAIWEGGLVFYGGFIASAATALYYLRRHRLSFLAYSDTAIPFVALGHFFGRLGCFAAGCCWGKLASLSLPWSVRFPPESLAFQAFESRHNSFMFLEPSRHSTLPLHPVQIYEAVGELTIFLVLIYLLRKRKRFDGQILATWLVLYSVLRTIVELFRGDLERGVYAGLGVGQWTSIGIFAMGVVVWAIGSRRPSTGGAPSEARPPPAT